MDAKPMDKAAEDRLLGAVKEAVAWVEDGIDPTDAIAKVAGDLNLNADTTALLVQAYNTGRTAFQRESNSGDILGKMAEFPLARVEDVIGRLWPSEPQLPKQASVCDDHVPDCFLRPPSITPRRELQLREKAASVKLPRTEQPVVPGDPNIKMAKAYGQAQRQEKIVEEARYQSKVARDRYLSSLSKLADYFIEAPLFRASFEDVEYNGQLMFGEPAKHAMDYVYARNKMTEKRASGTPFRLSEVDPNSPPYTLLKAAIDRGREVLAAQREHQQLQKKAQTEMTETLRPFCSLPSPAPTPFSVLGSSDSTSAAIDQPSFDKTAGIFGSLLAGGAGAAMRGQLGPKPQSDMVAGAQNELTDPQHLNALRQIEAQTMLNDFLSNDEVLSGHDPEEVLQAYNEVVELSPHAATQPAVMRPLLRKRLSQGSYEPFEAQQIADIEKSVSQANQVPSFQSSGMQSSSMKMSEVLHGSPILD